MGAVLMRECHVQFCEKKYVLKKAYNLTLKSIYGFEGVILWF